MVFVRIAHYNCFSGALEYGNIAKSSEYYTYLQVDENTRAQRCSHPKKRGPGLILERVGYLSMKVTYHQMRSHLSANL